MIASSGFEAARLAASREKWSRALLMAGVVAAVGLGLLAGALAVSGQTNALVGLAGLAVPAVVWKRPAIGVFGLGTAGLVIEQNHIGVASGDLTDHIPWFVSLSDGFHLSGIYINTAEVGILLVLAIVVGRAGITRQFSWPSGWVGAGYLAILAAVALAALRGIAGGGNSTMVLWEMRPFLYVFVIYFLALQLDPSIRALDALYWCLVVGTGIKAVQGLILLVPIITSGNTRPDYLLSHDDAFFFDMEIVLVASLWLFKQKGRLRTVATMLLPVVVVVNMANSRRSAWLMLAAGVVLLLVMFVVRVPERRGQVFKLAAVAGVLAAIYLPVFWNQTGILAQPARAVHSTFDPSQRDQLSDQYRVQENANLILAIRASTPLGAGFGIPINYVVPILDLSKTDPFIKYITHDGIFYVWWRMGWLGIIAWLSWIAFVMVSAVSLLRSKDIRIACFGTLAATCVASYVIEGYYDFGLFWFRMAFFVGLMIGLTQIAHRIDQSASKTVMPSVEEAAA
ncbi:MAG TPA: O-antigen ligase family protein [Candidatus Dormibacteraeota bacterium]|nr:O-antigen ligase family protein [Candidatus Dormibacteraeota bacterium]